jgi:DNA-binding transcriptional ArsR family regulator/YHS domain-containing protein
MYERLFHLQEEILKTLANHKRLEIIQLLKNHELTVNQMVEMLGISQTNVSQHLSVMRRLKLVKVRKEGLHAHYSLTDERIAGVINELRAFLKSQYRNEPEIAEIAALNNDSIYPIVKDPVCGMRISVSEAGETLHVNGTNYYFCAQGCKEAYNTQTSQRITATIKIN